MGTKLSTKFFFILVYLLIALICLYLFIHSAFFQIDKISVTGLNILTQEEIVNLSEIDNGMNIFQLNEQVCAKAIETHPLVRQAKIIRHLPREIEIEVEERQLWAIISYDDTFLAVDGEGVCIDKLSTLRTTERPIITIDVMPEQVYIGQAIQTEGIDLVRRIWENMADDKKAKVSDFHLISATGEVLLYTIAGTEIRFGNSERFSEKMEYLNQIFLIEEDFLEAGENVLDYVDLKYKGQPVLKTRV
ncbi:MAG: cell division protein FtsQ/DivIB [Syntrophomonadaceae bacterium]|jgi:cell division protein FtsQ